MYILGIGTHINCGSAILKDGIIIAAVNDERIVREKMVFGFPRESISQVLKLATIKSSDIDYVGVSTKRQHLIDKYVDYREGKFGHKRGLSKQIFFQLGSMFSKLMGVIPFIEKLYYLLRQPFFIYRKFKIKSILQKEFNIRCPIEFIDHHFCHAASAYYSSKFDNATVVTIDSAGDGLSSQVYKVIDGQFTKLQEVSSFNSPCAFYSYATELCGFKAGKHEGKITGLAAYGKPSYIDVFRKLIVYENGTFRNIGNVFFYSALKSLREMLPANFKIEDLSHSIQQYTEEMAINYIRHWVSITRQSNIALAGGLFANVRINQSIHKIPDISSIFVHPAMSDEGQGTGAALALYYAKSRANARRKVCMSHVYLGPEFSSDEIKRELDSEGIEYGYQPDIEKYIAQLLANGYVVARFNGRMEYGPRALGNRSILYQATDPSVNDWLNKCLIRTEFMPFAPATLIEEAEKCYLGIDGAKDAARFMTITFNCTEWMKDKNPGVDHVDGTARPQLVDRNDNASFYRIIQEYKKITGLESIINTSFNMHEEPIVCTPGDAIRAFKLGHLDYLAIGNFLVKNGQEIMHPIVKQEFREQEVAAPMSRQDL